jgi:calcineurin-like phosphoesterase family protein
MEYFTGDLHFNHKNILKYSSNRNFNNINEMNKYYINIYNNTVKENDIIYNLGDISLTRQVTEIEKIFAKMKDKMDITNNILILGNHDYFKTWDYINVLGYSSVHTSLYKEFSFYDDELKETIKYPILLVHDPSASIVLTTDNKGGIVISGHVHQLYKYVYNEDENLLVINVDPEVWDNKLVTIYDLYSIIKEKFDYRRFFGN